MPSFVLSKLAPHVSEPDFVHEMLKNGKDPKDKLISHCSNHCTYWKDKLTKCESKLDQVIKVNPSKSCMYPMRDWVTCVDSCVNPMIFHHLKK